MTNPRNGVNIPGCHPQIFYKFLISFLIKKKDSIATSRSQSVSITCDQLCYLSKFSEIHWRFYAFKTLPLPHPQVTPKPTLNSKIIICQEAQWLLGRRSNVCLMRLAWMSCALTASSTSPNGLGISNEVCVHLQSTPSRRVTRSGPAPTVCLREVSALEGDEVNDWRTAGTNSMCPL